MVSEICTDLADVRIEPSNASATFLEMGFDSLFLTQVTQALQGKFGLKVTFRQLLGDQSSLKSLTEFIDSQLPADAIAPKEMPTRVDSVSQAAPNSAPGQTQPITEKSQPLPSFAATT